MVGNYCIWDWRVLGSLTLKNVLYVSASYSGRARGKVGNKEKHKEKLPPEILAKRLPVFHLVFQEEEKSLIQCLPCIVCLETCPLPSQWRTVF